MSLYFLKFKICNAIVLFPFYNLVTWMKGLCDITNNYRSLKEVSDDYIRLTLKRPTRDDVGTYCILAKNMYGCDRAFFTVRQRYRARSLTPNRKDCSNNASQEILSYQERRYFTGIYDACL